MESIHTTSFKVAENVLRATFTELLTCSQPLLQNLLSSLSSSSFTEFLTHDCWSQASHSQLAGVWCVRTTGSSSFKRGFKLTLVQHNIFITWIIHACRKDANLTIPFSASGCSGWDKRCCFGCLKKTGFFILLAPFWGSEHLFCFCAMN